MKTRTFVRRPDEVILIGEGENTIQVVIHEIKRNTVSVSVTAPRGVLVDRKEIRDARNAQ